MVAGGLLHFSIMHIGEFRIEQLSEGIFEMSAAGSIQKVRDPRGSDDSAPDTVRVGLDPVLVDTGNTCVLLDAGLGMGLDFEESERNTSNIVTNLEIFGYSASDIRHVILSHLHIDHIGGISYTDALGSIRATLPNAVIHVQSAEWQAAMNSVHEPDHTSGPAYEPDSLYRLMADGRIHLIDQPRTEILPGCTVIQTAGHTPGHQIVRIHSAGASAYFAGDLLPNEQSLRKPVALHNDHDSVRARKARALLAQQAWREKSMLLFYHSEFVKAGRIAYDKARRFVVKT